LLVPIGLTGVLLALETTAWARRIVVAAVMAWTAVSVADTARLYAKHLGGPPADLRVLADALVARGITTAYAPYWTAYAVTFMTDERVKVASTDFVRIEEYQSLAAAEPGIVEIRDQPCPGGEQVARWYLRRGR
jgi:hypothetical protein